jgi:hypothetical protein
MALNERDVSDPRLERLYREAAREGPPAHLDAAILAAARREVGARPCALSSVLRRWHVPVSIAAVVVVSVSLVILVKEEGGERIGEARIPPVTAPAGRSDEAPRLSAPATVAKQVAQPRVEASAPAEHRESRDDAKRPIGSAPAVAGAGTPGAREAAAEPRPFAAAPSRPSQESAAAPQSPATVTAGRLEADSPDPAEQRATAPAADALSARPMARALAVKPAAQERAPVWQGFEKEPPEKWLVRIETLMREGRAAEAEEMRAEFKRRFPEHPLPRGAK